MRPRRTKNFKLDWILIVLYVLLVGFGYINIISASSNGEQLDYFTLTTAYGKQLVFILFALFLTVIALSIEAKFYERFSSVIYLISIFSLLGLFVFGKNVNGAISWYSIGGMTIQPSEFAKFATALAVAKYLSDLQTNIKLIQDQLKAAAIVFIPATLTLLQNDAGSTLIYTSFFFVFYREGIPKVYLIVLALLVIIGVVTLKFSVLSAISLFSVCCITYFFFIKKIKRQRWIPFALIIVCSILSFGISTFYYNVLRKHQQDRISLWLRLEKDPEKLESMKRTILYNLNESEKAISAGGFTGKGFMEGTRTTGNFVPEQHTDYIFSTIGEEWGFFGATAVVILFVILILRIIYLAEQQKSQFSRVYGYGVAAILFFHFTINIGMVMGLIPTIGIPLPFFSAGGSSLWSFTLLLFIFVKLDANKINEW